MKRHYSTIDVSAICGVDPVTVARWCDKGDLPCHRTPGGHRRILATNLREFLRKYGMEVPAELASPRLRILAVASDARLLTSLKRRFREREDRVEFLTASGGIEGLLKVGTLKPRVVLLDLDVPGVDGLEACRQIRTLADAEGIKIIALGSVSNIGGKALKAGADLCLPKPLDLESLESFLFPRGPAAFARA